MNFSDKSTHHCFLSSNDNVENSTPASDITWPGVEWCNWSSFNMDLMFPDHRRRWAGNQSFTVWHKSSLKSYFNARWVIFPPLQITKICCLRVENGTMLLPELNMITISASWVRTLTNLAQIKWVSLVMWFVFQGALTGSKSASRPNCDEQQVNGVASKVPGPPCPAVWKWLRKDSSPMRSRLNVFWDFYIFIFSRDVGFLTLQNLTGQSQWRHLTFGRTITYAAFTNTKSPSSLLFKGQNTHTVRNRK